MKISPLAMAAVWIALTTSVGQVHAGDPMPRGEVFENVVSVMSKRFYDAKIRRQVMPELAERYREQAHAAATLDAERDVIQRMLGEIPASHLGLLSGSAHQQMMLNLQARPGPTFGMELVQIDQDYFVTCVLEGGPADDAGIKRGDKVIAIDGVNPGESPRLDWRSDDAALPDPPMHALLAQVGDQLTLRLERSEGQRMQITVDARLYSAFEAAKHSAEVVEIDGRSIAYIHFWFIHTRGMDTLLEKLVQGEFKNAEALVLDLRGRGGDANMVMRVLKVLAGRSSKWRKPIVALIDAQTRSAKEMLAWELQSRDLGVLVGQTTAGALLPAMFEDVGGDSVLMYPAFSLGKYSQEIEGKGVKPDVEATSPLPFSAGADPIREVGMKTAASIAKAREVARQPA